MTGGHGGSQIQSPSPQLSRNACEAERVLRTPSLWDAFPKGNSSKQPSISWRLDIRRIPWTGQFYSSWRGRRQKGQHNYLQSSHQESRLSKGSGMPPPSIHNISTSQTTVACHYLLQKRKKMWSLTTIHPNKLRQKGNKVSKLSKCANDLLAPRPICKQETKITLP